MFDWSNNTGDIDVKIDGSFLDEKSSFKMLGLTSFSKLDWGSYNTVKTASKKIGALICSMKFLSPEVALLVPHPDVFWYRLNGMGAEKNAPKKGLVTFFSYIFHVKTR